MQMPARTPAMTAMTAMTLDQLSGGRFLLGLGLSGPQVVEGWHGQPYSQPLTRSREYISILRQIFARKGRLTHEGKLYQIPYQGADATGLGKPLKSILHGRADLPIYLAAIGPKNVALAAEIADGWLPIFFAPEHYDSVFKPHVEAGLSAGGKTMADFDIAAMLHVVIDPDLETARNQVRPMLALYIGGMGAAGKNFYFDLACRYGFESAAHEIQNLYLNERQFDAVAAVPDALVDAVALCGSPDRIRDQVQRWRDSPATTLNLATTDPDALRLMAELLL
jgi:F420-dependent oxidoreductase-like protein